MRIAVVGGGITGLAAARAVAESGTEVTLFEASNQMGGKIRTEILDGVIVEHAPDSFLARDPMTANLCRDLGLELVQPAVFGAAVYLDGALKRLPVGFPFGIPTSPWRALRAGVLGLGGAVRAAADLVLPGPLSGPDVSVADFVSRRFGRPTLERCVDPLLAGTRAGRPRELSLAAALPQIDALARSRPSVMRALRAAQRAGEIEVGPPPFLGVRGGMQRLVDALAESLEDRVEMNTNAAVELIEPRQGGYAVVLADRRINVRGVIVAVPAYAAAPLLDVISSRAAGIAAGIKHASVAIATLVYPPGSLDVPPGISGVLIPSSEKMAVAACTFFSTKWPESAPSDRRQILRAFVGRAGRDPALDSSDAKLTERIHREVAAVLKIARPPERSHLVRLDRALAQYAVGHLERVGEMEKELAPHPIALPGAGYRGSGIPDCIKQGYAAAERVTRVLEPVR